MEFQNEVVRKLTFRIRRYSPVIFEQAQEGDKLRHLASSVLLRWKDGNFLVMAAHTRTKGTFYTSNGGEHFFSIDGPKSAIGNDNYDVRIMRFNQIHVNEFLRNGFEFFDLNKIDVIHDDLKEPNYLIVGYPTTSVRKYSAKSKDWEAKIFSYRTLIQEDLYKRLNVNKETNIIVRYGKERVYNVGKEILHQGPDLEGISGSGIWRIPSFKNVGNDIEALNIIPTGIVTREERKQNAIVGTRLNVIGFLLDLFLKEMDAKGLDIDKVGVK